MFDLVEDELALAFAAAAEPPERDAEAALPVAAADEPEAD